MPHKISDDESDQQPVDHSNESNQGVLGLRGRVPSRRHDGIWKPYHEQLEQLRELLSKQQADADEQNEQALQLEKQNTADLKAQIDELRSLIRSTYKTISEDIRRAVKRVSPSGETEKDVDQPGSPNDPSSVQPGSNGGNQISISGSTFPGTEAGNKATFEAESSVAAIFGHSLFGIDYKWAEMTPDN
ncbi:hypothetical protein QFC19_003652 [Naganishia cerealis]|uniref:Uncharacterized protein n=1 Tax=Naganishia cerealis TaxID=610337 RepID=A0ACC2W0W4_9TREE|nr:hypothetical protein QFC19_003652 [Naganishia cerealis]